MFRKQVWFHTVENRPAPVRKFEADGGNQPENADPAIGAAVDRNSGREIWTPWAFHL